ncbi:hypothetical protein GIX77_00165 [Lactobacillus reuteri]|uniref:Uncharacterized protein n=1 Tax=Limosilactobacillus reuteri TaxID=1598 RepID=A0A7X2G222_LIMRT|nr:hypothetical protein [Limosilactobacillus reuteri]MRH71062.1 hypothetical protein [Limosilactobacillus reuteri]MRH79207.1 hypothetical protein [Limosilactobacillus reuteri]
MSRGIRMNVFMNKAMINQAKKQSMEHSKNNKTRKQELIKKYEKRQRTATSPKKAIKPNHSNKEIQKLRQQINKLEQERQRLIAKNKQAEQQNKRLIRQLKNDNRILRQQLRDQEKSIKDSQLHNDQAAAKLMVEYSEISSWLKIFDLLEIDPFAGGSARLQLQSEYQEMISFQSLLLQVLNIVERQLSTFKTKAKQYNKVKRQCNQLASQLKKLQKSYQEQFEASRRDKREFRQKLRDFELENERMRNRYVNGDKLSNAFHIMFDQLNEKTVQQYAQLAPLLERVIMTFKEATVKHDSPFMYGYYYEKDGQAYIGDQDGQGLKPLQDNSITKRMAEDLQDGVAIKAQRVGGTHYQLVNTLPWVNKLFRYLSDYGSFQPNRLVATKGTIKLSKLLSERPKESKKSAHPVPKVIMGKVIGNTVRSPKVINCKTANSERKPVKEKVTIINPDKIAWLYSKNLLLIGNKKIDFMVTQLRKYVNLSVMDAYEESLPLIYKKIQAADYVFVLLGSVPHSLTNYLKQHPEFDNKVECFYRADANESVRRLNYLYMNSEK